MAKVVLEEPKCLPANAELRLWAGSSSGEGAPANSNNRRKVTATTQQTAVLLFDGRESTNGDKDGQLNGFDANLEQENLTHSAFIIALGEKMKPSCTTLRVNSFWIKPWIFNHYI